LRIQTRYVAYLLVLENKTLTQLTTIQKSNHRKYERKGNSKRSESGGDKPTRKQDADGETTEQNRLDPVQASNNQVLTTLDIPEPEKPSSSMNPEARARRETAGEDRALLKHVAKNIENKYTGSINSTGQQVKRKFEHWREMQTRPHC
jgi:hypothetical protein